MQIQKNINPYELYSNRVSSTKTRQETSVKQRLKSKRKTLYSVGAVLSVIAFVFAITAINLAFDSSVMALQPEFRMNAPEYSSLNGVFAEYEPTIEVSVVNRGADKVIISTEIITVEELLANNDFVLDESCIVNHSLDTTVYEGMEIIVDSVTYEEVEEVSSVPFTVKTVEVSNIPRGTRQVVTKGQNGSATTTYRKKFINGNFDSQEILSEKITKQPIQEVSYLGVGGSFVGGDGVKYSYSYYIDVSATCYGSGQAEFPVGKLTATGYPVDETVIAVDPNVIPLHTKCYVTGSYQDVGVRYARDTGGAIKGNKIDIYFNASYQELRNFGRRNMRVYILD